MQRAKTKRVEKNHMISGVKFSCYNLLLRLLRNLILWKDDDDDVSSQFPFNFHWESRWYPAYRIFKRKREIVVGPTWNEIKMTVRVIVDLNSLLVRKVFKTGDSCSMSAYNMTSSWLDTYSTYLSFIPYERPDNRISMRLGRPHPRELLFWYWIQSCLREPYLDLGRIWLNHFNLI